MIKHSLPKTLSTIVATCALLSNAQAASFSGNFTNVDPGEHSGVASQFDTTNLTISGQSDTAWASGRMFCIDYDGFSLDELSSWTSGDTFAGDTIDLTSATAFDRYASAQNSALVKAQVAFAIDTIYYSSVIGQSSNHRHAMALVLWEVMYDGGKNDVGLSFADGDRTYTPNADNLAAAALANTFLTTITNAGITTSYTQQKDWVILNDEATKNQDYIYLPTAAISVAAVPEPSSVSLLGLGGISLLIRRKR